MVLSVNQVLVIGLILVLIAFVVVVAIMAYHAIELIENSKKLINTSNGVVEIAGKKLDDIEDTAQSILDGIKEDMSPVLKIIGGSALVLTALNLSSLIVKLITNGSIFGGVSTRRERKRAEREIRLSKKALQQVNKQVALEREAHKRAEKQSQELKKKEARAAAKDRREAKKALKRAIAERKALARETKRADRKAARAAAKAAASDL
jgi:hypothetical protein